MLISRLKRHIKHSRDQIVGSVKIGSRKYKTRGYLPFRLAAPTEYEPHVALTISNILQKRKGVFVDVGANVGQTLFTVLRVDPNRCYLGFEPQIACCHYLQQFIEDNRLMPLIQIFPVALSSKNGFFPFFAYNAYDDCGSLLPEVHAATLGRFVAVTSSALLSLCASAPAQSNGAPGGKAPPKLVLFLVIDGFPQDQLVKYYDLYGDRGFKLLLDKGGWYGNNHYSHATTYTSVGHEYPTTCS